MGETLRLDALLVVRGIVGGRDRAKELIEQGLVLVEGRPVSKAAQRYPMDVPLEVLEGAARFVSRGAHKLEGALAGFGLDLTGKVVLDVGASAGGFTQCALERGAVRVYAVDVGSGQLAQVLQKDQRVVNLERTDIRRLAPEELDLVPEFAVCDVSFISLTLVLPSLSRLLSEDGQAVALIKPQFEAGRGQANRKGVIRDPKVHLRVIRTVLEAARQAGFVPEGLMASPILGGAGNREFLVLLNRQGRERLPDLEKLVYQAVPGVP